MTKANRAATTNQYHFESPSSFARIMREACPVPHDETIRQIGEICDRIIRAAFRMKMSGQ